MWRIYWLALLFVSTVVHGQEMRRLFIEQLTVSFQKAGGKDWDVWKGAPDLRVVVSVKEDLGWREVFVSPIWKDSYEIGSSIAVPADLPVAAEVRLQVIDKDFHEDDIAATHVFSVPEEETTGEIQFGVVTSCKFIFSQYKSLAEKEQAERELEEQKKRAAEELLAQKEREQRIHQLQQNMRANYRQKLAEWMKSASWRTIVNRSHLGYVGYVAYSPTGDLIATAGSDNSVKIWQTRTGKLLRTIYAKGATGFAFSPDGGTIAIGSRKNIGLYEVHTGKLLRSLDGVWVLSMVFSADGSQLISRVMNRELFVWNISTGEVLYKVPVKSLNVLATICLDGSYIITDKVKMGKGGMIYSVSQLREGKLVELCQVAGYQPPNLDLPICSPDKRTVALEQRNGFDICDLQGNILHKISTNDREQIHCYNRDGSKLITTGKSDISIWNVESGQLSHKIPLQVMTRTKDKSPLSISPDGRFLVVIKNRSVVSIVELESGRIVQTLEGDALPLRVARYSPDGRFLAALEGSYGESKILRIWNTGSGQLVGTIRYTLQITDIAWTPDSRNIAIAKAYDSIRVWNVESGEEVYRWQTRNAMPWSLAYPNNGEFLAVGCQDQLQIYKPDGKYVTSFKVPGVFIIACSYDGKMLAVADRKGSVKILDARTGNIIQDLEGHRDHVCAIDFSPQATHLATAGLYDDTVKVWDVKTRETKEIKLASGVSQIDFSPDGTTLAIACNDKTAKIWDFGADKILHTLHGHPHSVLGVQYSPDKRHLATLGYESVAKIWDCQTWQELGSLIALGENDWVVLGPEGHFDSSTGAINSIHFAKGLEAYSLDDLFDNFYRPGLLVKKLLAQSPTSGNTVAQTLDEFPAPLVTIESSRKEQSIAKIAVKAVDQGGGIVSLAAFNNGKRVGEIPITQLNGEAVTHDFIVSLIPGKNFVQVYATNEGGVQSASSITIDQEQTQKTKQYYILTVGIGEYQNMSNLFQARFQAQEFPQKIGSNENTQYAQFFDSQATKQAIIGKLHEWSKQTKPDDVVILYYAGHSTTTKGQYYLLPYEFSEDFAGAISLQELADEFKKISALQQVLILNTWEKDLDQEENAEKQVSFDMIRGNIGSFVRWSEREKAFAVISRKFGFNILGLVYTDPKTEARPVFARTLLGYQDKKAVELRQWKEQLDGEMRKWTQESKGLHYHRRVLRGENFTIPVK